VKGAIPDRKGYKPVTEVSISSTEAPEEQSKRAKVNRYRNFIAGKSLKGPSSSFEYPGREAILGRKISYRVRTPA
jgi:hypothetical protein